MLFSLQHKKGGGKNNARYPYPHTFPVSNTLSQCIHHPLSGMVTFTDGSPPHTLLRGLESGHLCPEAKSPKHVSPSSLRLLCKQEVFAMDLTGALSLRGWRGWTPFVRAVFLCWMPLALGKDHVVWEAGAPVKWQQPLMGSIVGGPSGGTLQLTYISNSEGIGSNFELSLDSQLLGAMS